MAGLPTNQFLAAFAPEDPLITLGRSLSPTAMALQQRAEAATLLSLNGQTGAPSPLFTPQIPGLQAAPVAPQQAIIQAPPPPPPQLIVQQQVAPPPAAFNDFNQLQNLGEVIGNRIQEQFGRVQDRFQERAARRAERDQERAARRAERDQERTARRAERDQERAARRG